MDDYERDYDQRQYGWMAYFLEQYQLGKVFLGELTGNLEGLLNALHAIDADWEVQFEKELRFLDMIYTNMVIDKNFTLNESDAADVSEAVANLINLVQTKLDNQRL